MILIDSISYIGMCTFELQPRQTTSSFDRNKTVKTERKTKDFAGVPLMVVARMTHSISVCLRSMYWLSLTREPEKTGDEAILREDFPDSTMISSVQMYNTRECLVCSVQITAIHLGMDICRFA